MLLRASGQLEGDEVDLQVLRDPDRAEGSGVPQAGPLLAFAEAVLGDDESDLSLTRAALLEAVGPEAFVDAAGVVGNFERMVRIANATGIPLDAPVNAITAPLQRELGLEDFDPEGHTPAPGLPARLLASVARACLDLYLRIARRRRA